MGLFFVFDVESVGLHGEGYAYGFVVVDESGNELGSGECACDPQLAAGCDAGRAWIKGNCPQLTVTENSPRDVRFRFAEDWKHWQAKGAVMAADCPWPVEGKFLNACVSEFNMEGPYPLIDVASVVLAGGGDPIGTFDRIDGEMPRHDPLCDARQSARILTRMLGSLRPAEYYHRSTN